MLPLDRDYLIARLTDLVRIDSVNPRLVPDAPGEAEIAAYIAAVLRDLGIHVELQEVEPRRPNVVGVIRGTGGGRSVMLNAHMDTVGIDGMRAPFAAATRGGRLHGRGAQDMKGSIAAMLTAAKSLVDSGTRVGGDIVLAFVVDEEYGSSGTEHLMRHVMTDAAILTEPTGLEVAIAHGGFWVFEFETRGRAAHGGCPDDGVDANMHMGRIIAQLSHLSSDLQRRVPHPLVGRPSLHIPRIEGGTGLFVYADRCMMRVERRTTPGESADAIRAEMTGIIERLAAADSAFRGTVRPVLGREPYEIDASADIVQAVAAAARRVRGKAPTFIGHSWWEDSALIAEQGVETVIIGPTGAGMHSHDEWVEIDSVIDLARILVRSVIEFAG